MSNALAVRPGFAHRLRVTSGDEKAVNEAFEQSDLDSLINIWVYMDPIGLLTSPMLWAGLVVATSFAAAAVMLRRYRDDSSEDLLRPAQPRPRAERYFLINPRS